MLKKAFNYFLSIIKRFFRFFGIEISFIHKDTTNLTPIERNSKESANSAYSSKDYQKIILSKEHQLFFKQISDLLSTKKIPIDGKTIADFGCGIGNLIYYINKTYKPLKSYGYDFSDKVIELAKKRLPDTSFIEHDIYKDPNIKFDIIFCTETLEHLLYPDKVLQNFTSILLDKGYIFITVPDGRKDTFIGHINFWSVESWEVFIKNNCPSNYSVETGYLNKNILYSIIKK